MMINKIIESDLSGIFFGVVTIHSKVNTLLVARFL